MGNPVSNNRVHTPAGNVNVDSPRSSFSGPATPRRSIDLGDLGNGLPSPKAGPLIAREATPSVQHAKPDYRASLESLQNAVDDAIDGLNRKTITSAQFIDKLQDVRHMFAMHTENFEKGGSSSSHGHEASLRIQLQQALYKWIGSGAMSLVSVAQNDALHEACMDLKLDEIAELVQADQSKSRETAAFIIGVLVRPNAFADVQDFQDAQKDLREMRRVAAQIGNPNFQRQIQDMLTLALKEALKDKSPHEARSIKEAIAAKFARLQVDAPDMGLQGLIEHALQANSHVDISVERSWRPEVVPARVRVDPREPVEPTPTYAEKKTRRAVADLLSVLNRPKHDKPRGLRSSDPSITDVEKIVKRLPRGHEHEVEFHRIVGEQLRAMRPEQRTHIHGQAGRYLNPPFLGLIDAAMTRDHAAPIDDRPNRDIAIGGLLHLLEKSGATGSSSVHGNVLRPAQAELQNLREQEFPSGFFDYNETRKIVDGQLNALPFEQLLAIQQGIDNEYRYSINSTGRNIIWIDDHVFLQHFPMMLSDAVKDRLQLHREEAQRPKNRLQRAARILARPFKAISNAIVAVRDRKSIQVQETRRLAASVIGKSLDQLSKPTNDVKNVNRLLGHISKAMPGIRGDIDVIDATMLTVTHELFNRPMPLAHAPSPEERIQFNAYLQVALSKLTTRQVMAIQDNIQRRPNQADDTFHVGDLKSRLIAELARRPDHEARIEELAAEGEALARKIEERKPNARGLQASPPVSLDMQPLQPARQAVKTPATFVQRMIDAAASFSSQGEIADVEAFRAELRMMPSSFVDKLTNDEVRALTNAIRTLRIDIGAGSYPGDSVPVMRAMLKQSLIQRPARPML